MKRSPHHLGRAFTLIELLGGQRKDSDTMKTMQWSRMANLAILLGLVFQAAAGGNGRLSSQARWRQWRLAAAHFRGGQDLLGGRAAGRAEMDSRLPGDIAPHGAAR